MNCFHLSQIFEVKTPNDKFFRVLFTLLEIENIVACTLTSIQLGTNHIFTSDKNGVHMRFGQNILCFLEKCLFTFTAFRPRDRDNVPNKVVNKYFSKEKVRNRESGS